MRLVTFSQLVWLLVGLFSLSFFSVMVLDLRFYLAHSASSLSSSGSLEGLLGPEALLRGQEGDTREEEKGETLFNNYANNHNLSVKKDRQREAKGRNYYRKQ